MIGIATRSLFKGQKLLGRRMMSTAQQDHNPDRLFESMVVFGCGGGVIGSIYGGYEGGKPQYGRTSRDLEDTIKGSLLGCLAGAGAGLVYPITLACLASVGAAYAIDSIPVDVKVVYKEPGIPP